MLDRSMTSIGWDSPDSYARFLQVQYAARRPIEDWIARDCPDDLSPPVQTAMLAADLDSLGAPTPEPVKSFSLPFNSSPIGAIWALAGSSLGNKVIARRLLDQHGHELPFRFLACEKMSDFWKALLPRLDGSAAAEVVESASDAALAVFDHFLETVDAMSERAAA